MLMQVQNIAGTISAERFIQYVTHSSWQAVQPTHQVGALTGVGISRLVRQSEIWTPNDMDKYLISNLLHIERLSLS